MRRTVIVTKEHTEYANYLSNTDCPLARAIKEQHPDFKLKGVGGSHIRDITGTRYYFDENEWSHSKYLDLLTGRIDKAEVTF